MRSHRRAGLVLLLAVAAWSESSAIELEADGYVVTEEEDIVTGFGTPITDVTVAPNGDIFIADWGGGRIFRLTSE